MMSRRVEVFMGTWKHGMAAQLHSRVYALGVGVGWTGRAPPDSSEEV